MPTKRLPPLNSLKAFEAAGRYLSFTKAAEELFVTQAAVSHQIKGLEEFLGIKLFVRKNRALLLTEEGQSYFLDIRDIFANIHEATDRLAAMGSKGTLTIALPASFASQWLVPKLHQFTESCPDIDVRIKAVDDDESLLSSDVDVAIYYGRGNWAGLKADKLHTEYLTPMCSPLLLSGDKPLRSLQDLANHNLLHDESREAWKNWMKVFGLKGVTVNKGPIFSHSALVLQAAALGQGIALGHTVLARPEISAGRLICPFKERMVSQSSYYFVCEESQSDLGKIAAFREWMLTQVIEEQF